jgi:hypothetical protein
MKKTIELCKVRPGETFTLDGVEFVKLDEEMGQAFVLTRDVALKNVPFEGDVADRDDHNNFCGVGLSRRLATVVQRRTRAHLRCGGGVSVTSTSPPWTE